MRRYKDWRLAFGLIEGEEIVGGLEGDNIDCINTLIWQIAAVGDTCSNLLHDTVDHVSLCAGLIGALQLPLVTVNCLN